MRWAFVDATIRILIVLACVELGCVRSLHERAVSCEKEGGRMNVGLADDGDCVFPTSDGGKLCRDARDCEFECWGPFYAESGTPVVGRCADWPIGFGCHNRVKNGRASGRICID
jgi:hypothetical protein